MKDKDFQRLKLEAQLLLLQANAQLYSANLFSLYHDLTMKSYEKRDTVQINTDAIYAERRVVDDDIVTLKMLIKAMPLMQRISMMEAKLHELGESKLVKQLSKEYPLPDMTSLLAKYQDKHYGETKLKELKREAVKKVEKPKVVPKFPEPLQRKIAVEKGKEYPMSKRIKWRAFSSYPTVTSLMQEKGPHYVELFEKVKEVFSAYIRGLALELDEKVYFVVMAMEDMANETHLYEALQMYNGYIKGPFMYAAQLVTTSEKRAQKMITSLEALYDTYKDSLKDSTQRDWIVQMATDGTFTSWRKLLFWLLEKSYALKLSFSYNYYDYEEQFMHYNNVNHWSANDDACNVAAMTMLSIFSEYLRRMGLNEVADKSDKAFSTEPMYFVCQGKKENGHFIFTNPWHNEMEVSPEGIGNGDEIEGKCVYTSLVYYDGLYYVNTDLYPKTKAVYTKWLNAIR